MCFLESNFKKSFLATNKTPRFLTKLRKLKIGLSKNTFDYRELSDHLSQCCDFIFKVDGNDFAKKKMISQVVSLIATANIDDKNFLDLTGYFTHMCLRYCRLSSNYSEALLQLKKILPSKEDFSDAYDVSASTSLRFTKYLSKLDLAFNRLDAVGLIDSSFNDCASMISLVGSMAYGPFTNTTKKSDVDILLVVKKGGFSEIASKILKMDGNIEKENMICLIKQLKCFFKALRKKEAQICHSQIKFSKFDFPVTLTLIPEKIFEELLKAPAEATLQDQINKKLISVLVKEEFADLNSEMRDFYGQRYPFRLKQEKYGEFNILSCPVFWASKSSSFMPGGHLNLLSPYFEILDSTSAILSDLAKYRSSVLDHMVDTGIPLSVSPFTRPHIRYREFSPTVEAELSFQTIVPPAYYK